MSVKSYFLVFFAAAILPLNLMAQPATFDFSNGFGVNQNPANLISIATGTDPASLAAATLTGTNSTSESLGAGPGQVNIDLYIALNGTAPEYLSGTGLPPSNFFLAGTTTNSGHPTSTMQGTFTGGDPYTIPATLDGGAFTKGTVIEYQFYSITQNGNFAALSELGTDYTLSGTPGVPASPFGTGSGQISGWTLTPIPEPSSVIFGALSTAALLLRWRKSEYKA